MSTIFDERLLLLMNWSPTAKETASGCASRAAAEV
jgi:hypothetical protein